MLGLRRDPATIPPAIDQAVGQGPTAAACSDASSEINAVLWLKYVRTTKQMCGPAPDIILWSISCARELLGRYGEILPALLSLTHTHAYHGSNHAYSRQQRCGRRAVQHGIHLRATARERMRFSPRSAPPSTRRTASVNAKARAPCPCANGNALPTHNLPVSRVTLQAHGHTPHLTPLGLTLRSLGAEREFIVAAPVGDQIPTGTASRGMSNS